MKTFVKPGSTTTCPTCARPLPGGAPSGLCPACLLEQGADTEFGGSAKRTRYEPPQVTEISTLFPQLEVLRLIGSGGMGAVYQARQPELDRLVALKILPADGDEGIQFTERFNREARALARLNHPNVVTVYEFGSAGRVNYFLMEFVDGANLRQLARVGRISPREALQIIPQICDALQYAHDEGVVHRDIKPENVLIDRRGQVKIADFGLARILGSDTDLSRLTLEGQVIGTPHYMAPEQVEDPHAVDHRADIYALGVVFYEMLTGDLPLGKFAPPSRKVQVDVRLDEIVMRALENNPERRYQHASEVKRGVEKVVEMPETSPTQDTADALTPVQSSQARFRMGWLPVGVLVIGLIAFVIVGRSLSTQTKNAVPADQGLPILHAQLDPGTHTLRGRLPDGRVVALLALRDADGESWMRPDNTPATGFDGAINFGAELDPSRGRRIDMVFEITGSQHSDASPEFEFRQGLQSIVGGNFYYRGGDGSNAGTPVQVIWPESAELVSLRVGMPVGEWQTIQRYEPSSQTFLPWLPGKGSPTDIRIQTATMGAKGLQLTVVHRNHYPGWNLRAVAATSAPFHFEFTGEVDGSVTNGSVVTTAYVFPALNDMSRFKVDEFKVQACPVEWVEFEGLRLPPVTLPTRVGR